MENNLIFCSIIFPGNEADSLLLAKSIRHFGGALSGLPIWFMQPQIDQPLDATVGKHLHGLDVCLQPFPIQQDAPKFFFSRTLSGLAHAETLAASETGCLAWMDANTVVVNEPSELLLPPEKDMGYRPVHHLVLGSRYDQPLDPFWVAVYAACDVSTEGIFPMRPVVEDVVMRPYFNAGFLVVRPGIGLMRTWAETFFKVYQEPEFKAFYARDGRYHIFMHQAILAGVVLHHLNRDALLELPPAFNYPVHLFDIDKSPQQPTEMDKLITFRHEGFFREKDWQDRFPGSQRLISWLQDTLAGFE